MDDATIDDKWSDCIIRWSKQIALLLDLIRTPFIAHPIS